MSLFDYQPGELSLLLNPSAQPDVYQLPKPAAPATIEGNKRALEGAEQQERQHKRKRVDRSLYNDEAEQQNGDGRQRHRRVKEQAGRTHKDEADGATGRSEHDEADVDDDNDDSRDSEPDENFDDDGDHGDGELSDLSDLDDSALYADMDPATARQLRQQKRLHEDHQAEQQQQQQNKRKLKTDPSHDSDPRLPRTLFVGNVPTSATRPQLVRFFKQFGGVESCRLRSFSVSNPKLTKRVAMIKGAIHPDSQSMNAYVVYEEADSVEKAVARSGVEYEGHKLRLDYADRSRSMASNVKAGVSAGLSVFVGNLPFNVSEQQLYDVFDGCGELTAVRVVRDPLLALGKGFAFVTFGTAAAVKKALAMQGVAIDGRELRLTKAMDETKAREVRDKRRQDAQPATSGAARRVQEKVKHAERKAAVAVAGRSERRGRAQVGEVSNPLEYVQKARRVEKKQKMKKEERRKKRSLVKVKKPRMKPTSDGADGAAPARRASAGRSYRS